MSTRATDNLLGELHLKLAEAMLAKLHGPEPLTAAEMNAITTFLKANNIEATAAQNPAMEELARAVIPSFDDPSEWDGSAVQ